MAGNMKTLIAVALALVAILSLQARAEKNYNFANIWNDANKGGFMDQAPMVFKSGDVEETADEFAFQIVRVPRVTNLRPLFCTRLPGASAVQCFYVPREALRGEGEVIVVVPRE